MRSAVAALLVLTLALGTGAALAQSRDLSLDAMRGERRLALVIGNDKYSSAPLRNPVNDARAMAQTLRRLGFEVIAGENLSQREMRRAILEFGDKLRRGGVGLFYFAGHGLQVNGRNYMIPVDATIASEAEVEIESVDVANVLARMDTARNRLNLVVLDACRDNPFARSFRSTAGGLASIDAPSGTMIAYATAPGRVARDGEGANGLYTGELLKSMQLPGMKIEDVFKRVRQGVQEATRGDQVPWESSSLVGDFLFALPVTSAVSPGTPAPVPAPRPEPRRELGSLALSSKILGVEIWVDDVRLGETRSGELLVVSKLASGSHRLRAYKPGHRPWEQQVEIVADQRATLIIDIEPIRGEGQIVKGEDGAELVLIPAGEFWMGDDAEERTRPRHRVFLDTYYLHRYEVTNAQFERFIAAKGYERQELWTPAGWQWRASPQGFIDLSAKVVQPAFWTDSKWNAPSQPVVGVSWYEADAFCRFAGMRLPTEAQWEKSARGTEGRKYPWGDTWEPARANSDQSKTGKTVAVGSHPSGVSPYGVHDMAGNAWEWVADWYSKEYYRSSPDRSPPGPVSGEDKVLRGGSWDNKAKELQTTTRRGDTPTERGRRIGFRCARDGAP